MARGHGVTGLPLDDQGKVKRLPFVATDDPTVLGRARWNPITGEPQDIQISRVAAEQGLEALAAAHEIGHRFDRIGGLCPSPRRRQRRDARRDGRHPPLAYLPGDSDHGRPPATSNEVWARAYAQYLAWRSGSSILKNQVDRILTTTDPDDRVLHWPYDEFAPVAAAIDRLMEAKQWARKRKDT